MTLGAKVSSDRKNGFKSLSITGNEHIKMTFNYQGEQLGTLEVKDQGDAVRVFYIDERGAISPTPVLTFKKDNNGNLKHDTCDTCNNPKCPRKGDSGMCQDVAR